jgi:hypothetical protein
VRVNICFVVINPQLIRVSNWIWLARRLFAYVTMRSDWAPAARKSIAQMPFLNEMSKENQLISDVSSCKINIVPKTNTDNKWLFFTVIFSPKIYKQIRSTKSFCKMVIVVEMPVDYFHYCVVHRSIFDLLMLIMGV